MLMIMSTNSAAEDPSTEQTEVQNHAVSESLSGIRIDLLTGCQDRHYAFGLAMALAERGVYLDVIGSDEEDSPEFHNSRNLRFFNFRSGYGSNLGFFQKLSRVFGYYVKLTKYVADPRSKILHILWNYKLELFDRTILMLYYKVLGKKVVLTAHNVNQARRDATDSWLNRTTLKIQYRLCDHIFVHTLKMKEELRRDFGVGESAVTVIRYPVNNALPETGITAVEAKRRLGLGEDEKAILFFGRIRPYKGIELLLDSFRILVTDEQAKYRLIIAGEPKKGSEQYLDEIQYSINRNFDQEQVIQKIQFIPDDEMELYLKAADILVLPYKEIFQSGILFLAYSFGLPVVATDVGSFGEDVIEGRTGFLCKPGDPVELAKAIRTYFTSDLYKHLEIRRQEIRDHVNATHSWRAVAELTCSAYSNLLGRN
jgi:glycosyltransferase involved in cell wall biosynthesis